MTDEQIILSMFHGMWQNRCLGVIVGLNIPEILCSAEEPSTSIDDLAVKAGCHSAEQLYPIMRVLAQWGIGKEVSTKHFAKNKAMELLRKDRIPSLGHMMGYYCSDENWAAMLALPEAVKTGRPAFEVAHGMNIYDYMNGMDRFPYDAAKSPSGSSPIGSTDRRKELLKTYNSATAKKSTMQLTAGTSTSRSIFDVYPWSNCGQILDIGSSLGGFLATVLKQPGCEGLKAVLVDLPDVIGMAQAVFPDYEVPFPSRVTFVPHNCLEPFPPDLKADTIIARYFFVIFKIDEAIQILQNCRSVYPDGGGRLLIITSCPPEPGDRQHNIGEDGLQLGYFAINAVSVTRNGQYRTKTEWLDFIHQISQPTGFELVDIYQTVPSGPIIFELKTSCK